MIDIKNITKSFGALQVLKGIDLHIDKGEVVSIVGPSGEISETRIWALYSSFTSCCRSSRP